MRYIHIAIIIMASLFNQLWAPETGKIKFSNKLLNAIYKEYNIKKEKEPSQAPLPEPSIQLPKGRWITVVATAYSPNDKIDRNHKHCKDDYTASMTRISKNPYGVAVPMLRDSNGRSCVPTIAKYGTQIYIPSGYGYLDNLKSNPDDRIFICDDTGGKINKNTRRTGLPHIDLRFMTESAAKKFGVKKMEVFIYE